MTQTETMTEKKPLHPEAIKKRIISGIIILFLGIYSVLTITPFYFLVIRSFVPTVESTNFYAKIPENKTFDIDAKFGNIATFYNMDVARFKEEMGISGFLNMNLTIRQIGEKYAIDEGRIRGYFQPYYLYNGWLNMLQSAQFYRSFFGTVIVTVMAIFLGALLGSATGYGLSSGQHKWQQVILTLYLLQMAIPGMITMLPSYIIVRTLGLTNTWLILILVPLAGGALSTMIFTTAASGVPKEIRESLIMDGGGPFRYYRTMLLPLIKPSIGAYALITLPHTWNSLLGSVLYNRPEKYLLMAFINTFSGNYSTNFQAIYAGLVLALLPILVLYLALQKLFVRAALAGAVKQ